MLNEIRLKKEAKHAKKRVGRGIASGTGKTWVVVIKGRSLELAEKYK